MLKLFVYIQSLINLIAVSGRAFFVNDFVMIALGLLATYGRTGRGHFRLLIPLLFILLLTAAVGALTVHRNESISLENEIGEELEPEAVATIESNRRGLST